MRGRRMKDQLAGKAKFIFLSAVLVLALVAVVNAQGKDNRGKSALDGKDPLVYDAEVYASNKNVSTEEALRRFQLQDIAGKLDAGLSMNETGTFAGLWVEHTPKFRVVVQFTHDGEETIKQYMKHYPELANIVELRTAEVSLAELQRAQADASSATHALGIPVESGINVRENRVELYVAKADMSRFDGALQRKEIRLPDKVRVIPVEALAEDASESYDGLSLSSMPDDTVIEAAGWNGRYWLISTIDGDIIKYDGQEFSYLANLGCTPLEMEWFKDHWIFGCRKPLGPDTVEDTLVKYDGERFVNISAGYAPQMIKCNKEYCLMFGGAKDERIMKYDGSNLVDLTEAFSKTSTIPWIKEFEWNGGYWLITTGEDLVEYDGGDFMRMETQNLSVATFGWNGDQWLVVLLEKTNSREYTYTSRVFKYDGSRLEDLELSLPGTVKKIAGNGDYWLLRTLFNKLMKYDGKTVGEVSPPGARWVYDVAWNGEYWLLLYSATPGELRIAKYDGQNFSESEFLPQYPALKVYGWSGEYWLIGTSYGTPAGLLKYDDSVFTDLTPQFNSILEQSYSASKPGPSKPWCKELSTHYRVIAPIAVLLIVTGYLVWKKTRLG